MSRVTYATYRFTVLLFIDWKVLSRTPSSLRRFIFCFHCYCIGTVRERFQKSFAESKTPKVSYRVLSLRLFFSGRYILTPPWKKYPFRKRKTWTSKTAGSMKYAWANICFYLPDDRSQLNISRIFRTLYNTLLTPWSSPNNYIYPDNSACSLHNTNDYRTTFICLSG